MATVSVAQETGDILVSRGGDPPVIYPVKKGLVEVEDEFVGGFLSQIPGAQISAGKAAGGNPTKEA